ncbi:MAG: two-component regulator propeller domain-containing protein [Prevotellaceae bacterium]|nr:two-component regulator propeller domain-containing protein [Prevotellaceae bacterium]
MKKTLLSLIAAIVTLNLSAGIGDWKSFLAYSDISQIVPTGNQVYVLSSNDLFSYDVTDESITEYNKVTNLNDTYITHIAYCKSQKTLVVVYRNSNIDLIDADGDITNVSDIYRKSTTDDKTITGIQVYGNNAYLMTAFGFIVLNVKNAEISGTYKLNESIRSIAVINGKIFASASQRVYIGDTKKNLLDKSQWETIDRSWYKMMFVFDGKFCISDGKDVYIINLDNYSTGAKINDFNGTSFTFDDDYLIVCNGTKAQFFTSTTEKENLMLNANTSLVVYDKSNKCFWQTLSDGYLSAAVNNEGKLATTHSGIKPDSPKYNNFGFMKFYKGQLYTCGKGFAPAKELSRPATVQVLKADNEWKIYQDNIDTITGYKFIDALALDIDPNNDNRVVVGGRTGMYEYLDGNLIKTYTCKDGSPLQTAATVGGDNKNYVVVSSVVFDKNSNLWCFNSIAPSANLLELKKDYTWADLYKKELDFESGMSLENVTNMFFDSRGLLWFGNENWDNPYLFCYDTSNDKLKVYKSYKNEDGTNVEVNTVNAIAEDKDGSIWIGTNVGPLMLPQSEFDAVNPVFTQIKVPRNDGSGLADYLLGGVSVSSILIDGGNRKWFGSQGNGLYLIDSDNITQKEHLTMENSPLFSNEIESLAINGETGELFIGTDCGLCSYMTDSTSPSEGLDDDKIWAYPNPVVSDYNGLITVVGLTDKAQIKIVNPNGYVVAEGISNGGTFTWDARDKKGRRVASGVYIVMAATADGKSGALCKIAVIN